MPTAELDSKKKREEKQIVERVRGPDGTFI